MENDNFEVATQLANLATSIASKLRDTELRKTVKEQQDEVKLLQKHWQAAQAATETLKQNPDDPGANLIRGKYLCLVKQEWERGLPLLVKSSDATIKAAAERELATRKRGDDKSALGDAWLAAAKAAPVVERGAIEDRAEYWYKDALDEVSSQTKTHVERRLSELKSSGTAKTATSVRAKKNQGPVPGMAGRVMMDNGDTGLTVFYQPGMQLKDETLKGILSRHNLKWRPLQVDLGGYFNVPVSGTVWFHQNCRGPIEAGCRLLVDNQEVSTVGPSDASGTTGRQLGAGVHSIRWIVAGRDAIGACDLRLYMSSTTGIDNLSVFHLPQNLPTARRTKAEENLSSN